MSEYWKRLEKTYGDRTLNIVTVKNNLQAHEPKWSQRWEKVTDLHEVVEKAISHLKVLEAVNSLNDDFELVSSLVAKLAVNYQEECDKFCVAQSGGGGSAPG